MRIPHFIPFSFTAAIKVSGMPQRPNPPTNSFDPDGISATAAVADENILDAEPLESCLVACFKILLTELRNISLI